VVVYGSCRAAIDRLRQQNARLKEDLLLENKFSVRPSNPGATQLINKLQDEADLYTRKVSTRSGGPRPCSSCS
jgi:hypothetical protein